MQTLSKEENLKLAQLLRNETGFGMMECRKILFQFDHDYERAKQYLLTTPLNIIYAGKLVDYK